MEFIHFLERVVPRAKRLTKHRLLCRLDSGHDAAENRAWMEPQGVDFIIKWNPRRQDLEAWLKRAEKEAEWSVTREGKRVGMFCEIVDETFAGRTREFRRVIRVTERTIDKHGNRLLVPEIKLEGCLSAWGQQRDRRPKSPPIRSMQASESMQISIVSAGAEFGSE